ncbi:hypothetical protein AX16_000591 [Volvariella volvacea WC 439]|nr:hypothetical protein AX16_000591 [Volvariella volvacea WC 439]
MQSQQALTALKFKPPDQSIAYFGPTIPLPVVNSHLIIVTSDLRSKFPLFVAHAHAPNGSRGDEWHDSGVANIKSSAASWKAHAIALERDYASLKELYEAERISTGSTPCPLSLDTSLESESTRNASNIPTWDMINDVTASATVSGSVPKKKAGKKKATDVGPESQGGRKRQHKDAPAIDKTLIPEGSILFQPIGDLIRLTSLPRKVDVSLLLSTSIRIIAAIGKLLLQAINSCSSGHPLEQPLAHIVNLRKLLYQVLPVILSIPGASLSVNEHLDTILSNLASNIFEPLINGFFTVSLATFSPTVLPPNSPSARNANGIAPQSMDHPVIDDLRPAMFDLFQAGLSLVIQYSEPRRGLVPILALEIIRQLKQMLVVSRCSCGPDDVNAASFTDSAIPGHRARRNRDKTTTGNVRGANQSENAKQSHTQLGTTAMSSPSLWLSTNCYYLTAGTEGRVRRLAQKDAIWYLCALLHILCPNFAGASSQELIILKARNDVLEALLNLASTTGYDGGINIIGKGSDQCGHDGNIDYDITHGDCGESLGVCGDKRAHDVGSNSRDLSSQQGGVDHISPLLANHDEEFGASQPATLPPSSEPYKLQVGIQEWN